jgi:hypothetical protein
MGIIGNCGVKMEGCYELLVLDLFWKVFLMNNYKLVYLILVALVLVGFLSCKESNSSEIIAYVTEVKSESLTRVKSLKVVDTDGNEWVFENVGKFQGFTPSHLFEHSLNQEPIIIKFKERLGSFIIVSIDDY